MRKEDYYTKAYLTLGDFDPDHMLDELYRVLKPKGICILITPNLAAWFNRFALPLGYQPGGLDASLRYYVGKLKDFENHGGDI